MFQFRHSLSMFQRCLVYFLGVETDGFSSDRIRDSGPGISLGLGVLTGLKVGSQMWSQSLPSLGILNPTSMYVRSCDPGT